MKIQGFSIPKKKIRMGLVENMMIEGIGLDGKGCTDLKGNLGKS